jgi:hypothetical protein
MRSCALLFAVALLAGARSAGADELEDAQRDRFKQGLERYQAGAVGEALQYWEPLYRELGPERGYRVGYDLARAYDALGDATRSAERYEAFVSEVKARRERGDPIEPIVAEEEAEATRRLSELARTRGRLRVPATSPPVSVRVNGGGPRRAGGVAWVAPGPPRGVFAPGTADEVVREVRVDAGAHVEVEPPPLPRPAAPPIARPPVVLRETAHVQHPFSAAWIGVPAGLMAVGVAITVGTYANALSVKNAFDAEADAFRRQELADLYDPARVAAYVSLSLTLVAAGATTALTAAWLGLARRTVLLVPQGAGAALVGRF